MEYKKSYTLSDKINKRIEQINKSFSDKKKSDNPDTQKEVQKFIERFSEKQADTLYKHIPDYAKAKYAGIDEDYIVNTGLWQEYLVKEWLDKINLDDIKPTERKSEIFKIDRTNSGTASDKSEKIQCRNLKYNKNDKMGELLDFQVPLKARKREQKVYKPDHKGELDLVARQGKEMVLIEFKIPDSTEPLLRAVLEAITYFNQIGGNSPAQSEYLKAFNKTFSLDCDKISLAIVVPKKAYEFGHDRAFNLIEKFKIRCYTFGDKNDYNDIVELADCELAALCKGAKEKLKGIYENTDIIVSGIDLNM